MTIFKRSGLELEFLVCSELVTLALQIVGRVFLRINDSATTLAQVVALPCLSVSIEIQHKSLNFSTN